MDVEQPLADVSLEVTVKKGQNFLSEPRVNYTQALDRETSYIIVVVWYYISMTLLWTQINPVLSVFTRLLFFDQSNEMYNYL